MLARLEMLLLTFYLSKTMAEFPEDKSLFPEVLDATFKTFVVGPDR